jgi:hypothetical protein
MLSWILIVLAHWNKSLRAPRGHYIWIPSKPMFALFSYCCVASRKTTNTNLLSLVWPDPCFLTLYRSYKLKLKVSRKAWDTKVVIRNHYRRIEGQTLKKFWIKRTPAKQKKIIKQTNKQTNKTNKTCTYFYKLYLENINEYSFRSQNKWPGN